MSGWFTTGPVIKSAVKVLPAVIFAKCHRCRPPTSAIGPDKMYKLLLVSLYVLGIKPCQFNNCVVDCAADAVREKLNEPSESSVNTNAASQ